MQGNIIDNEAVLQQQVTKGQNQFLSTLAKVRRSNVFALRYSAAR